jgi:hypothetical protein
MQRLASVLLPLLMPLLAQSKPLITPATPLPGAGPSATTESVIKPEPGSSAAIREPGMARKAEPSQSAKPVSPKALNKSLAIAPSEPTPGLYLSRTDGPADLPSGYRFQGLLPPGEAARVTSKAGTPPGRVTAKDAAQRNASASTASLAAGHAHPTAVARVNAARESEKHAKLSDAAQAADPCSRMQSGTLVVRTGQADSRCSGAEFRATLSRQLKAAMADIDASAPGAGRAGMVSATSQRVPSWNHVTITSPPSNRSVMARAPGEDNLRRLNSRVSWPEQYQSRMAEIRTAE